MSTWHQDQAAHRAFKEGRPVSLAHETEWTVVEDEPNECLCTSSFSTLTGAEQYQARIRALGRIRNYILYPTQESK